MDGTIFPIARPGHGLQQAAYNGQKRMHGLKHLLLMAPDGLIMHAQGPYEARHHDSFLSNDSGVPGFLEQTFATAAVDQQALGGPLQNDNFCIFADVAFSLSARVLPAYKIADTRDKEAFNRIHKAVRVAAEWGINKPKTLFPIFDRKRLQRVLLSPLGIWHRVGYLLSNAHSCLYGNQTSTYFNITPLSVDEYFQ